MSNVIQAGNIGKPSDPSANKPVYLVIIEDPLDNSKSDLFYSSKVTQGDQKVVIRGVKLTKEQYNKLQKNPNTNINANKNLVEVEVPWQRVRRIENLTFRMAQKQGEKNE